MKIKNELALLSNCFTSVLVIAGLSGISSVSAQTTTGNLLINPGAELGTGTNPGTVTGWAPGGTSNPGRDNGTFDPVIPPHSGSFDFYGHTGSSGTLDQTINLLAAGLTPAQLIGATANYDFFANSLQQGGAGGSLDDTAGVKLNFLGATSVILGTASSGEIISNEVWGKTSGSAPIPTGTVAIDYQIFFTLHGGSDLDAFVDDVSLTVTTVPEPGTLALAFACLGLLALIRRN